MATKVFSCLIQGIEGKLVEVEVDILTGLPSFSIVGLGDAAIQEARERVRSAIKSCGLKYPQQKKIVNLAPAHLRKHGPHFDLPIAAGLLAASKQLNHRFLADSIIAGELALDGSVRPVRGALSMALFARDNGYKTLIIPSGNVAEARMVEGLKIVCLQHLRDLVSYLNDGAEPAIPDAELCQTQAPDPLTMDDIFGNDTAKRALEIAAAGGHHLLLTGPPGIGKTVLAKALASILPPMRDDEALEVMRIHSSAGLFSGVMRQRPFRQVHPGCSAVALTGGGSSLKPGEVSLAHRGVLFLDELPEFPRSQLESLRGPLEDKEIHLARFGGAVIYPAQFMLIASMNPCPCGYFGDPQKECICRPYQVMQYRKKLSGPLLDRIDLVVEVERQPVETYQTRKKGVSQSVRSRVAAARDIQKQRFQNLSAATNSEMNVKQMQSFCPLSKPCEQLLAQAGEQFVLSGRQYYQIIKVARTIADLENSADITPRHIAEALQYRQKTKADGQ